MTEAARSRLEQEIIRLSGSGKRVVSTRRNGIYSSFTLPEFSHLRAVRCTTQRMIDFGVPDNLEGLRFLDVGSNVGAVSFELERRGAEVVGLEYREDRVNLCNEIARHLDLTAWFFVDDFNDRGITDTVAVAFDSIVCCSVDEYIDDVHSFYSKLGLLLRRGGKIYLESNVQRRSELETKIILMESGLSAQYLGNGHSGGISRKRKLFLVEHL